jgi:exo-beta-1,3-glucanase (GH17 family)
MLQRSALRFGIILSLFFGLSSLLVVNPSTSLATRTTPIAADYPITLRPNQMSLSGDVLTAANSVGSCAAPWLANTPTGSIILGVDPSSCNPMDWKGGSATTQVTLPDSSSPTVLVLKISWPDRDGKGIHSPERDRKVMLTLDGQPLWDKRTTRPGRFGDYYAAEREPILTTMVLTQTAVHTLRFTVPPHTAWDISSIALIAYPMPKSVRGIGYSPYRDCQTPTSTLQPSTQDIREDLFRLVHTSNAIRTYASTGVNHAVPALANKVGLPVYAGAWLDKKATDEAELQGLIELANTTKLAGAIVGNEFYLRHTTDADLTYLHDQIVRFKASIHDKSLPVMTAEIDGFMFDWLDDAQGIIKGIKPQYKPILDEVNVVLVHIYPYWNGLPIDGAAAYTVRHYNAIRVLMAQVYPDQNKRVIIGETGWPSGVDPNGRAVSSQQNQLRYFLEFLQLAEQNNVEFMYFDAFDELWKIEEPGRVGQNWGYSYPDRSAKYYINSVLMPAEQIVFPKPSQMMSVYLPFIASSSSRTYPVYTEWLAEPEGFVPSGWMGDVNNIDLFECDRNNPHSGEMAIRASFSPGGPRGWAGVSWQDPRSNWGKQPGGHDLSDVRRLSFWARGAQGGEVVEFMVGGIGTASDPYRDSIQPARTSYPIVLSDKWEKIDIDLMGADLSRVVGGFAWVASRCNNSQPITFYLDDIIFEYSPAPSPLSSQPRRRFYVYDNNNSGCTHFASSGFTGDIEDLTLNPAWTTGVYRGATSIKATYTAQGSRGNGWAGVTWQEPENNWGNLPGGFDLRWANKLTFRTKGERGGEKIQFFVGGTGIGSNPYPDSLRPAISTGFVQLADTWQTHTIDLRNKDLSHVIGGFGWATSKCANPSGASFYLDDIVFEYDPNMPPPPPPSPNFPVYTDTAAQNNHYVPSLWMGDGSVPGRVLLTECWYDNPHSGQTSIRTVYIKPSTGGYGWAGVYWVHPAENTGDRPGGLPLKGAKRLTFWARSDMPNATVTFLLGGVGYPVDYRGIVDCEHANTRYPDTLCPPIKQTETLSTAWKPYMINLRQIPEEQLRSVVGGFGWVTNDSVTFYLDDIVYEFDQ